MKDLNRPLIAGGKNSTLAVSMPALSQVEAIKPNIKGGALAATHDTLPTGRRRGLIPRIFSMRQTIDGELEVYAHIITPAHLRATGGAGMMSQHSLGSFFGGNKASVGSTASVDREASGQMGNMTAMLTLLKAMIGPMLLFVPSMYKQVGVLFASVMFAVVGVLSAAGMFQLLECHDAVLRGQRFSSVSKGAFAEIGRQAAGAAGYVIVDSCLVASQFLFCVSYPIFIATNTRAVLESLLPLPPSVTFLTLAQLPVLVPYCWVRDIHRLGWPMLVANLVLWCTVALILALIGTDLVQSHFEHAGEVAWTARFGPGTLLFAAQAVVAFEGIGIVLPVREAMREPEAFPRMIVACMTLGTVAFLVFGICSYVAFGEATATFVTLNLNGGAALGVRAAFVLTVVLTYPLQFFPAMVALEDKLGLSDESGLLPCCAARTCLVLAAYASSLYAPYENLMGLAGGLCAVPLAFIFPGWFHLRLCKPRYGEGRALDITLVAFGVVMAPVAVVSAILSWH
mmetsp:Transcript_26732/g.85734  ORF Transcript_26732/g.85734 Transcript_26732/m.85734 type:complete len:512 (-) Transcript_26732:150-1685(-)